MVNYWLLIPILLGYVVPLASVLLLLYWVDADA